MNDKSETPSLEDRVMKFRMLALPGQPPMMHMGTSYLVEDLWRELAAAQNDLKTSGVLYWRERAEKAEAERDALREELEIMRRLFVSMTKNGRCITEEGPDDKYLWNRLWHKAVAERQKP